MSPVAAQPFPQPAPAPLPAPEQQIVDEIAEKIATRDCILFLGAGVHGTPQARFNVEDVLSRVPSTDFDAARQAALAELPEDIVRRAAGEDEVDPGARQDAELQVLQAILAEVLEPVYPRAARPLLGSELAKLLAGEGAPSFRDAFPGESPNNLGRVALYYQLGVGANRGRHALVQRVQQAVQTGKQPSPILRALAKLPFTIIVTTNYDALFERALRALGREPVVNVYDPKGVRRMQDWSRRVTVANPYLLKLHGDIGMTETIVITDEDYIQFVLRMNDKSAINPVPEGLRAQFKDNSVLFIGYSLMDYNLRLLFKTIRWSMDPVDIKPSYSVDPRPNELVVRVLSTPEDQVKFVAQDAWTIVPRLCEKVPGASFDLLGEKP